MAANTTNYDAIANVAEYTTGGDTASRLSNFTPPDAGEDLSRICFLRIEGDNIDELLSDINAGTETTELKDILEQLKGTSGPAGSTGYAKFSITGMSDSRTEKMQIMKTCGDSFIATFTGREPHVAGFTGNLIFDYSQSSTWYHAFINAYEYCLRASRLAKYRLKLRIVMPDCQELVGYMIALNTSHESNSDMIVPMSFSILVIDKTPSAPNQLSTAASADSSGTKLNEKVDGSDTSMSDEDTDAMKALKDHIPTSDDYALHNELATKISNGEELTEDEQAEYDAVTDKINNQGTYLQQYNDAKIALYQGISAKQKLTDSQANDLAELQETKYYRLQQQLNSQPITDTNPYGGLSSAEYGEYEGLATTVSATAAKRTLLEKQSAGIALTDAEKEQLRELQDTPLYTANSQSSMSSVPNSSISYDTPYTSVTQPTSPGAQAVINATTGTAAYDPAYKTVTVAPNSDLYSQTSINPINDTSGVLGAQSGITDHTSAELRYDIGQALEKATACKSYAAWLDNIINNTASYPAVNSAGVSKSPVRLKLARGYQSQLLGLAASFSSWYSVAKNGASTDDVNDDLRHQYTDLENQRYEICDAASKNCGGTAIYTY